MWQLTGRKFAAKIMLAVCSEKVQKEAERKLQSAAAEQARSNRLSEVDKERTILAKQIQEAEEEMKAVRHEMEPLNEQKAKLVMQLKQV